MKNKIIKLRNAKKVFPSKFTKVRSHDLSSLSIDKSMFLTPKEQWNLQQTADDIRNGLFGCNRDMLATRKRQQIIFEPLFDEDDWKE